MTTTSFQKSRNLDYRYDPLYTFSNEKDYFKAGTAAAKKNAKFVIRPIFYSMFSTLPNVPRYKLVMTKQDRIEPFVNTVNVSNMITDKISIYSDLVKFYKSASSKAVIVPELEIPTTQEIDKPHVSEKKRKNRKTQTKYRESSAQTSPWEPDFINKCDEEETPELLKSNFLKWGSGLPCGAHEVILIQRARMKREWEKNLPPCDTKENIAKRKALISAMERDEYAFREQEIQELQDLRLHLLELMLQELHEKSHERYEMKLKWMCELKEKEKNEKISKIKKLHNRESRRLTSNYNGTIQKYHHVNIIDEYIDKSSERYAPLMRHGEDPNRWHQVIDEHNKLYQTKYRDIHKYSTIPKWLYDATKINGESLKLPGTRLCIRETKWTAPVLKTLHEDLKELNKHIRKTYSLRVKIDKLGDRITTPEVDSITDAEEELHQATVLIQSIIRGRATQKLIYDGREQCNELIQELKSTQALLQKEQKKIFAKKVEVLHQQREHELCTRSALRIKEGLKKIQGSVIGTILDFLSKELRRLLEERKAHAMCLLYDRERQMREATEAHRRQLELRRRLEHDEIFKQVIKVHQDTVDMYLQDIITEGMEFTSDDAAKRYVESLAKKIDEGMDVIEESTESEEQEMIADLVHNFVLPEVQKQYVREKIKKRQAKYLQKVHELIYNEIEHLPKLPKETKRSTVTSVEIYAKEDEHINDVTESVREESYVEIEADIDINIEKSEEETVEVVQGVRPEGKEEVQEEELPVSHGSSIIDIEQFEFDDDIDTIDVKFFKDLDDLTEEEETLDD